MTNYTRGLLLAQKFSMEDQMGKKQKLICTLIAAFLVVVVNGGVSADVLLIQVTGEAPQSGPGTETKGSIAIKNFPGPSGATAPPVPKTPDLSGQWKSSIGLVYDITQKGDQFRWTVRKTNEKGEGILKGATLSDSWQGPPGSGSSQGQVHRYRCNRQSNLDRLEERRAVLQVR